MYLWIMVPLSQFIVSAKYQSLLKKNITSKI